MTDYAVGIDFGTTKSVVALHRQGQWPTVVPNRHGGASTPSVVAFDSSGKYVAGEPARRQIVRNPDRTFWSFKHLFGVIDRSSVVDSFHHLPEELAAILLTEMRADVELFIGAPMPPAVITVPAMFGLGQRAAAVTAATDAGIEVIRVLEEPVAAALAYGVHHRDAEQSVLVFDLGGGTLDVSVVEFGSGVYEIKSVTGDLRLGGDDWDIRIIDHLVDQFDRLHGLDLTADLVAMQRLREAAEATKIELSTSSYSRIHVPYVAKTSSGFLDMDAEMTRTELNFLTADLLERCRTLIERSLYDAYVSGRPDWNRINPLDVLDGVVLVGGASRIPAITRLVTDVTAKQPIRRTNPDEAVAIGAALQAGVMMGLLDDTLLLGVTPASLGVEVEGGRFVSVIARNTTIPTRRTEVFTTPVDGQTEIEISVFAGESNAAAGNTPLGIFELSGLAGERSGKAQIEVTFDLDANQRVEVTAKERDGTAEASLTVSSHTVRSARRRRARRGERPSRLRPPPDANPAAPARTTDSAVSRPVSGDANAVADHVFVSYSNEDHGYVLNLVEHLRRADVETWWSGDIISGSRWIEDLENRIASSAAVVVVVSHHSYRSQWVINEIIRAQDLNKRIFPLHLSGQRMLQLLSVQHEDVRGGELPSSAFVDSLKQATASAVQ